MNKNLINKGLVSKNVEPNKIVGLVEGKDGALSAPQFGYEVIFDQVAKQEAANSKVQNAFWAQLREAGIRTLGDCNSLKRSNKKIRFSKKQRESKVQQGGPNKYYAKYLKKEIAKAEKMVEQLKGTPAAQVYQDDIKYFSQQLLDMAA